MKKTSTMKMSRSAWILFSGLAALSLVVGLSLLLSHLQVRAQPVAQSGSDLEVTKDVSAKKAAPGDTLRYTITIENDDSTSVDVWMTDTLPDDLTLVSGPYTSLPDSGVGVEDGVITWSHTLDGRQSDEITFTAQISTNTSATEIKNVAQITGTGSLITNSASTRIQIALDNEDTYKTVDKDLVAPGSELTYTIVLSNSYATKSVWAEIVDPLDPLLDYVKGSTQTIPADYGTLQFFDTDVGSQGITWTVIISPSSSVTLAFQAVVSNSAVDGTVINNTATIHEGSSSFTRSIPVTVIQRPASQIRSPNRDTYITKKGTLRVSGIAWQSDAEPPYLTDDPFLSLQREADDRYWVTWTEVASATAYVLEESTQLDFSDADSSSTGNTSILFDSQDYGTYYYRVQARSPDVDPSRWSNMESVTVPWTETSASASVSSLSTEETANGSMIVQVRIDDGDWQTATVTETTWGAEWSWDWSMPEERNVQHVIQSRAAQSGGSFGPTDAVTVTLDNKDFLVYLPLIFKRWPPIPYSPSLHNIDNSNKDVSYLISWSYKDDSDEVDDPDSYTLQEARNADFTGDLIEYNLGNTLAYTVTDPDKEKENGTYYYRVRGHNQYGPGEWSNVEPTTVRVTPYAPTLKAINNPDQDPDYTVEWSYDHTYPSVVSYTLQEAESTSTNFVDVYNGSSNSQTFTDKDEGTYYYRVRANNSYGAGDWSDTKSTTVVSLDFYDNFNDPNSGWRTHEAKCCLDGCDDPYGGREHLNYKYSLYYENGRYHVYIPTNCLEGGKHGWTRFIYPVSLAPGIQRDTTETCIQLKGSFEKPKHVSSWGLVFASSQDMSTHYALWVNNRGEWGVIKRTGYQFPGPNHSVYNEHRKRIIGPSWGANEGTDKNTLRVQIKDNSVELYLNGANVGSFSDSDISSLRYIGIIGGNWEWGDTQIGYDYFYMDVGCDDY